MSLSLVAGSGSDEVQPERLRIRFSKHGKIRFTSHRDVARIWSRTLRRVGLPVAYSAGFSPRPRISFGLALPTGYESDAEYLDVIIKAGSVLPVSETSLKEALTKALPTGMVVQAIAPIDRKTVSLQQSVETCTWRIDTAGLDERAMSNAVSRTLASGVLFVERERKGRVVVDDIRPAIISVQIEGIISDGVRLIAELGTQPRATRPTELLSSLHPSLRELRVRRLHQWITTDSQPRREPLAAADLSVAASEVAT